MLRNKDKTLTYVSLFSSAGVGCYGFHCEGFHCVATNELQARRMDVQRANCKCRFDSGYVVGDVSDADVKAKIYGEVERWAKLGNDRVDVVMATPPCQGISVINHKKNDGEIKRNSLVVESVEIIRTIRPRIFLFENVQAFQKTLCVTPSGELLPIGSYIRRSLGDSYVISGRVLNFMNYGSNSSRTRTLVIGVDRELRDRLVPYDLFPDFRKEKTLRDVIGGFSPLEWGKIDPADFYHAFRVYDSRMRRWIHGLREGESAFDNADPECRPHRIVNGVRTENIQKSRDKYTRQKWNRFVQCVHTRNDQLAAQNTVHPVEDRVFSIREIMSMMTVPPSFLWMPKTLPELNALSDKEKRAIYRQHEANIRQCLGEAVPTEIVRQIAANIRRGLVQKQTTPVGLKRFVSNQNLASLSDVRDFIRKNPLKLDVSQLMRIAEISNGRREETEAFYTNKFIVNDIMGVLPEFGKNSIRILEPSVGVGNFLPFLFKRYAHVPHVTIDVVDIDPDSLVILRLLLEKAGMPENFTINPICDDFLLHEFDGKYDLVVGNPPFSRISAKDGRYVSLLTGSSGGARDIADLFLRKSMKIAGCVALVLNKTLLSSEEYAQTRDVLRESRIAAILDFGRYGFTGVSIETMCLVVEPTKKPGVTRVCNMKFNRDENVDQAYVTDPTLPYFIIYRDRDFDAVAEKMTFGAFDVVRDRQITKRLLTHTIGKDDLRVIKARNIADDGAIIDIDGYDSYIARPVAEALSVYRYVGDRSVYLSPNMTYNPRVIRNRPGWIPDGSVAVLVPHPGVRLTSKQMAYFSTTEYRRFYATARNYSTQSINIDKTSVHFFGVLKDDGKAVG